MIVLRPGRHTGVFPRQCPLVQPMPVVMLTFSSMVSPATAALARATGTAQAPTPRTLGERVELREPSSGVWKGEEGIGPSVGMGSKVVTKAVVMITIEPDNGGSLTDVEICQLTGSDVAPSAPNAVDAGALVGVARLVDTMEEVTLLMDEAVTEVPPENALAKEEVKGTDTEDACKDVADALRELRPLTVAFWARTKAATRRIGVKARMLEGV